MPAQKCVLLTSISNGFYSILLLLYMCVFKYRGVSVGSQGTHWSERRACSLLSRRVPFAIHDKLKSEFGRMKQADIIAKVTGLTRWVGVTELSYFGHVILSQGHKPDSSLDQSCQWNKLPAKQLQTWNNSWEGQLSCKVLAESVRCENLQFSRDHPQEKAFIKVKKVITQCPGRVLAYEIPDKVLILQVDASKFCLGTTLMRDTCKRHTAFASKLLTFADVNYAQFEKEMLETLFGCKHFHQYNRHPVRVETDHKPLVSIVKKRFYMLRLGFGARYFSVKDMT